MLYFYSKYRSYFIGAGKKNCTASRLFWPEARFEGFFGLREAVTPIKGQKIPRNWAKAKRVWTKCWSVKNQVSCRFFGFKTNRNASIFTFLSECGVNSYWKKVGLAGTVAASTENFEPPPSLPCRDSSLNTQNHSQTQDSRMNSAVNTQ